MTNPSIRIFVKYQNLTHISLINTESDEKMLIETIINDLEIQDGDWKRFELVMGNFQCKIKNSKQIRENDYVQLRESYQIDLSATSFKFSKEDDVESQLEEYQSGRYHEKLIEEDKTESSVLQIIANKEEDKDKNEDSFSSRNILPFDIDDFKEDHLENYSYQSGEEEPSFDSVDNISIENEEHHEINSQVRNDEGKEIAQKKDDIEIDIKELLGVGYIDRNELKRSLDAWASDKKMQLKFNTQERETKEGAKISILYCRKKHANDCPFYLQYKKTSSDSKYELESFWTKHNHSLSKYHSSQAITPEIYQKIKDLCSVSQNCVKIANSINKEFNKSFYSKVIYHQIQKVKEEEYGKASEDAATFISMLEADCQERGSFHCQESPMASLSIVAMFQKG